MCIVLNVVVVSCLAAFASASMELEHCFDYTLAVEKYSNQFEECKQPIGPDTSPLEMKDAVFEFEACFSEKIDGLTENGEYKLTEWTNTIDGILNKTSEKYEEVKEILKKTCIPKGSGEFVTKEIFKEYFDCNIAAVGNVCPNDINAGIAMGTGA